MMEALDTEKIVKVFASRAQTQIISYFLDNSGKPLKISKISRDTNVSITAIHRIVQNLIRLELVVKTKVGMAIRVYTLADNPMTKLLIKFLDDIRRLHALGNNEV